MIHDVDESLRELVRRDVLSGANVEISFEAPTRDWSARRNTPTINLYLYEIREDLERRNIQIEELRDETGVVIERRPPPRRFKLSYLITAWTQRPEDEHRILASVLDCFLAFDALPPEVLQGQLAEQPYPVRATIGLPLPPERSISDVWTALGGELKASLDLVVTAPIETGRRRPAGPPVIEEPRIRLVGSGGPETAGRADGRAGSRTGGVAGGRVPVASHTAPSGEGQPSHGPGRSGGPDGGPGKAPGKEGSGEEGSSAPSQGKRGRASEATDQPGGQVTGQAGGRGTGEAGGQVTGQPGGRGASEPGSATDPARTAGGEVPEQAETPVDVVRGGRGEEGRIFRVRGLPRR